jgi:uncharacterized metal-binding protein
LAFAVIGLFIRWQALRSEAKAGGCAIEGTADGCLSLETPAAGDYSKKDSIAVIGLSLTAFGIKKGQAKDLINTHMKAAIVEVSIALTSLCWRLRSWHCCWQLV